MAADMLDGGGECCILSTRCRAPSSSHELVFQICYEGSVMEGDNGVCTIQTGSGKQSLNA